MITKNIFSPRTYQREVRQAKNQLGVKRFLTLWHRRAGKDRSWLAFTLEEMLKRRGVYFHVFPALNQGRRDLWDNVVQERHNGIETSLKMTDMFPKELLAKKPNETDMQIELTNGSIYQVMGADSKEAIDRLRGPNPVGIIYSEYGHMLPGAWDILIPVLAENGGWAAFGYTPNGLNHGYDLYKMACGNPEWFVSKKTIEDTFRDGEGEDGTPVVTLATIAQLRAEGVREEFIQQEFYCSFTGYQHGTIYGDLMMRADTDGRITDLPYIVNHPVGVIFDLGQSDAQAMWFYQKIGEKINFIDYEEGTQRSIKDAVRIMREDRRYIYGRVVLPWDGRNAADYLYEMGFKNVHVCERTGNLQGSIEEVRRNFTRFYFDRAKCSRGIDCLRKYERKWDDELNVFSSKPIHNQWSHGADALRTGVEGGFEPMMFDHDFTQSVKVEMDFDPRKVMVG